MMRSAAIALDLRILSEINRKQTVGNTCKNHGLTANSMGGRSESVHTQMLANSPYTLDPHGLVRPLLVRQPWGDELFSLYWVPSSPLYPQSLLFFFFLFFSFATEARHRLFAELVQKPVALVQVEHLHSSELRSLDEGQIV